MENEKRYLHPDKNTIRLIARKGKTDNMFEIYIKYDKSDWIYLMSHRKNPQIYALLNSEINLNRLHDAAHKLITSIAQRGNQRRKRSRTMRRNHSQRLEDTVRYLTFRACEFVQFGTELS